MNSVVDDVAPVQSALVPEIALELVVNILNDRSETEETRFFS